MLTASTPVPKARPDRNKRPGVCHDPRWTPCVPFKAEPTAKPTIAQQLHDHRDLYLRAVWAGHDGEAEYHERIIDELIHAAGHHDADVEAMVSDLAHLPP